MHRLLHLILFFLPVSSIAQLDGENLNPDIQFKDVLMGKQIVNCGWGISSEESDSAKQVVAKLETEISKLETDSIMDSSATYIHLVDVFYEFRLEAMGDVNEQYCAGTNVYVKPDTISLDSIKPNGRRAVSYNGKYLILLSGHYYLGNCQKWSYRREYYLKLEE